MNFTYVIIEDNPSAIQTLKNELSNYPFLIGIGEATSYLKGKRLIVDKRPALVFLDVELDEKQGYDLINDIKQFFHKPPKIIMTTAHIRYAKEATNNDYLYFLEKPIDPDELYLAIEKFKKAHIYENRILDIKKIDGHYFFRMDDIYYLKSNNNKTVIVKTDLSEFEVSKTMKELSEMLPSDFLRIHKSYTVNIKFVEKINVFQKQMFLNVKNGILELQTKEILELERKGLIKKFDERILLKDNAIQLPIGELYIETVKSVLLAHKS